MTTTPILAMLNFNEPFTLETDAFGEGIGVVLTQQGRPIAFMSRALGVVKRSWSTYAKEMLAILQAMHTWRLYLLGRKIFIQTDQRILKYFMEQRIRTPEQQNRVLGSPILNALFVPYVGLWEDIKLIAKDHPYMDCLCQLAHNNLG
ncbi:Retrovirus-related Pol polyprotein from transposon 297 [Vitis vinifera]|uniref:Retrovirus-related Pol polyprotein from transposon 297 n=1 Tax=Vitis vinifera TaxID=29760 RepID=A0A438DJT2_VITVI|nr:Retrovirus-related Pol polyprotein from transposon 297 [Vitis vinifera]